MGTWTVRYRDTSGRLLSEVVSADSRSDVFAQTRRRGITPISVTQGAGGRGVADGPGGGRPPGTLKLLLPLLGAVLLLAAVVGHLLLVPPRVTEPRSSAKTDSRIANAQKRVRAETTSDKPVAPSVEAPAPAVEPVPVEEPAVVSDVTQTNSDGTAVQTIRYANGKTKRIRHAAPAIFESASDEMLAMAVGSNAGSMAPLPLDASIESDFRDSLSRKIVVNPDDTDAVKRVKEAVIQAREDMKAMVDRGMTVRDVLLEHQRLSSENAEMRTRAIREAQEVMASGDAEGARTYVAAMNAMFDQMGIAPIKVPPTAEEKAARVDPRAGNARNRQDK